MSDVFISYARQEESRVEQLINALETSGYSVWLDRQVTAGARYATEIEKALDEAKCVLVLWSSASVKSDWVLDEAAYARDEGKLIQVLLDDVELPVGFRQRVWLDLREACSKSEATAMNPLLAAVNEAVNR